MKTRIQFLDTAKAISILAVVLGHVIIAYPCKPYSDIALKIIYMFHVPAFFIISGILHRNTSFI